MRAFIALDILVYNKFGVCGTQLTSARPPPFLPVVSAKNQEPFLISRPDQNIQESLCLAIRQGIAVPNPQAFVACCLAEGELSSINF